MSAASCVAPGETAAGEKVCGGLGTRSAASCEAPGKTAAGEKGGEGLGTKSAASWGREAPGIGAAAGA